MTWTDNTCRGPLGAQDTGRNADPEAFHRRWNGKGTLATCISYRASPRSLVKMLCQGGNSETEILASSESIWVALDGFEVWTLPAKLASGPVEWQWKLGVPNTVDMGDTQILISFRSDSTAGFSINNKKPAALSSSLCSIGFSTVNRLFCKYWKHRWQTLTNESSKMMMMVNAPRCLQNGGGTVGKQQLVATTLTTTVAWVDTQLLALHAPKHQPTCTSLKRAYQCSGQLGIGLVVRALPSIQHVQKVLSIG